MVRFLRFLQRSHPRCLVRIADRHNLGPRSCAHRPRSRQMTPEEFRKLGHQIIDWIADYRGRLTDLPIMARTAPGQVKAQLPTVPPDGPEPMDSLFRDLERVL